MCPPFPASSTRFINQSESSESGDPHQDTNQNHHGMHDAAACTAAPACTGVARRHLAARTGRGCSYSTYPPKKIRMMLSALALSSLCVAAGALEVSFSSDFSTYSVTHGPKKTKIFSADAGLAVFLDGKWHSQQGKTLKMVGASKPVKGTHPALGAFTGVESSWMAGTTPMDVAAKNYAAGGTVTFEYSFPNGATGTSLVELANKTRDEVIVNFPAFTSQTLEGTMSWQGSFVGAVQGHTSKGPAGGPTVFFDPEDPKLETVVVGSALDNFKSTSAGPGTAWNGKSAWAPGTPGTIKSLPAGYTQTFMLHAGSTSGITAAIAEWGGLLQAYHKSYKVPDVTLSKIGYQTDNGAYYVFCRTANCSKTLMDAVADLKELGVPMGYLSFQGAGASSMSAAVEGYGEAGSALRRLDDGPPKPHAAPWCVNTWGPDLHGSERRQFPVELAGGDFAKALGIPLQLYAPYFCPESKYFSRVDPSSNWTSVVSDTSIEGCSFYGFQDVTPAESLEFYRWFFAKGQDAGMVSFEPDFMNQNYNCVPDFVESAENARTWQMGMAGAALEKNLTVQWCYATPTDILAALEMPAVTNFRVSMDFCYGHSWDVGVSSLIVWAAGAFPSKDTLWTSDNGKFPVPGCNWSPDHESVAAPLHVVIALMSTGPVGISDMIGGTNVSLIKRTITGDGTLLKPAKPLSSIDSALAAGKGTSADLAQSRTPDGHRDSLFSAAAAAAPSGQVYSTYTAAAGTPASPVPGSPGAPGWTSPTVSSWIFVSFLMKAEFSLGVGDFFPAPKSGAKFVHRAFGTGTVCVNGTSASACVSSEPIVLPKSDASNVTGGTDFAPAVTTVWPADSCASGYIFLGDLTKYVAASSLRFSKVACTATGVSTTVHGVEGERVPITVIVKETVLTKEVTIPASGSISVVL